MKLRSVLNIGMFLFGSGCSLSTAPAEVPVVGSGTRVLFIGNSYLFFNDIPGMLQSLADSAKGETFAIAVVAAPDFALIDHWQNGSARVALRGGEWKWVVLQQGPSSTTLNRDTLRFVTSLFAPEITKSHGTPALFSAWPTSDRAQDFDRAIESYTLAARDVNGLLLPVAAAWVAAARRNPSIQLYADGLHPSTEGAYLSSLVLYAKFLNKDPRTAVNVFRTRAGRIVTITPAVAADLKAAAAEASGF